MPIEVIDQEPAGLAWGPGLLSWAARVTHTSNFSVPVFSSIKTKAGGGVDNITYLRGGCYD